jgi:fructokinase
MLGQRLLARIKAEGVAQDFLALSGRPTTISLVGQDAAGNPSYTFYGRDSADCGLTTADLPALGGDVEALLFGSYACVVEPVGGTMLALAERYADRFIAYDPNTRLSIEADRNVWHARIDAFRRLASMIKVSTEDLSHLYPGCSPLAVAREWAAAEPVRLVVLTDGPNDIIALFQGQELRARPPAVTVADTVGAGDTISATLLADFAKAGAFRDRLAGVTPENMQAWLKRAARAAALTCSRRGADMPGLAELA